MKRKFVLLSVALLLSGLHSEALYSQNQDQPVSPEISYAERICHIDSSINSINENLNGIHEKQKQINFVNEGMNLLALLSVIIALLTLFGIDGIKSKNVSRNTQKRLFEDMIRHLYRNKVCTLTMMLKWSKNTKSYPSEEHMLKLKMLPDDIHFEQYYKDPDNYHNMHNLELLLRNYNVEIDVAMMHLKDSELDDSVKIRDFATLNFKTGFITGRIIDLLVKLNQGTMRYNIEMAGNIITHAQALNDNSNRHQFDIFSQSNRMSEEEIAELLSMKVHEKEELEKEIDDLIEIEKKSKDYYFNVIFSSDGNFEERFKRDLMIEAGKNTKDEDKIYMITK